LIIKKKLRNSIMNKTIGTIIGYVLLLLMTFTIFFEPNGEALGLKVFPSTPTSLIILAEILGNLAWLLGLVWVIVSILLLVIIFNEEIFTKVIKTSIKTAIENNEPNITINTIRDKNGNIIFPVLSWWRTSILVFSTIMSLFCIGSGFWFTGSAWLLGIIIMRIYRNVVGDRAKETIREELENVS